jgi:hypothetical protein
MCKHIILLSNSSTRDGKDTDCLGGDPDHHVVGKYVTEDACPCEIFAVSDDVLGNRGACASEPG